MKIPCRGRALSDPPLVMGILNLTPDSFSDGGRWTDPKIAVQHAFDMIDQGADIIDIGAESTRPGSEPVPEEEEWSRLSSVLKEVIDSVDVPISVDTLKPGVARKAIDAGAHIINDVNGLRMEGMIEVCADSDVCVAISHMHGEYGSMHRTYMEGAYKDQIRAFLDFQCARCVDAGISDDRIIVDPGIGFGKTPEQNMGIVEDCGFLGSGHPILIGVSRKRFVREFYPDCDVDKASAVLSKKAIDSGASIVRVHNVEATVRELGI